MKPRESYTFVGRKCDVDYSRIVAENPGRAVLVVRIEGALPCTLVMYSSPEYWRLVQAGRLAVTHVASASRLAWIVFEGDLHALASEPQVRTTVEVY